MTQRQKKIFCVIPIRKGSKGIKNKNIKKFDGIGIHIRRGDFVINKNILDMEPNKSPPIEFYIDVMNKIKCRDGGIVTIYSDQSIKKTIEIINQLPKINCRYEVFSPLKGAKELLNHMMQQEILVHSNSTLSTWSSILTNQIAIYPFRQTPYSAHLYCQNFISHINY